MFCSQNISETVSSTLPVVSMVGLFDFCQKRIHRLEVLASLTNSFPTLFFAGVISAVLFLQPSPVFAVEIQLQLHAGLDFTDCGASALFYDSRAGYGTARYLLSVYMELHCWEWIEEEQHFIVD